MLLSGCSQVRDTLGLDYSAPDEFGVHELPPLSLPPEYDVTPPSSQKKLIPDAKNVRNAVTTSKNQDASSIEKKLTQKITATVNTDEQNKIRQTLEQENPSPSLPQEKTLKEKVFFWQNKKVDGHAIDPQEEQKKLCEKGVCKQGVVPE